MPQLQAGPSNGKLLVVLVLLQQVLSSYQLAMRHSILILSVFTAMTPSCLTKDLAWNGHAPPGSRKPTRFTPFYVPPGAKAYLDTSPFVHYTGRWSSSYSSSSAGHSLHSTFQEKASVSFTFTGTGIEWFGNCDKRHGEAAVYINGKKKKTVNTFCNVTKRLRGQRLFWDFNLPYKKHTIKIVNVGRKHGSKKRTMIDIDALVVTRGIKMNLSASRHSTFDRRPNSNSPRNSFPSLATRDEQWDIIEKGTTGVNAMQLAIISDTHALIVDKVEHNPLTVNGHPAWAALYNINTHAVKPLAIQSNSFCAGGTFLSNGSLINVGGNPVVEDRTSAADFGDLDGLQAIRLMDPCDEDSVEECEIYENHARIRMASPRWYNTVVRLDDGSAMIIGGSRKGGWMNNATVNNPTIEYFPPKSLLGYNGLPIPLQFLIDTLNSNLFPISFLLPDGNVFMAANQDAMIYDWKNGGERRLPRIPNGVRVTYPMAGTGLLLPLSSSSGFEPEILLCGGSDIDDTKPSWDISSQDPASSQCSRMLLTEEGISAGWEVEQMPYARTMADAVLLPNGKVLLVNGAGSGISGYGNVRDQVGMSNADNPVLTPVLYDPQAPAGQRFSTNGMPTTHIPRLYHSSATLTPNGDVMVAGGNPNLDRSEVMYGTEYRVEWIRPPYMAIDRPEIIDYERTVEYGAEATVQIKFAQEIVENRVQVALMDLGFSTHAVHANSRLVYLDCTLSGNNIKIRGPPSKGMYPPGPGWLYVLVNDIPSKGVKVMVGDGSGPPVDEEALRNLLSETSVDQYDKSKTDEVDSSE